MTGRNVTRIVGRHRRDIVPGDLNHNTPVAKQELVFGGTGIWGHYFEPVSDFSPGDRSCEDKLYVTLTLDDIYLIIPGLHGYWDQAVRCWRYDYLPEYISRPHLSYFTWIAPQRERAAAIVKKQFHFRPYLLQRVTAILKPDCDLHSNPCLGLHIRHADKAAGRRLLEVAEFLPYAVAFVRQGGRQIYVATDSATALQEIKSSWPAEIASKVRSSSEMVRSTDTVAVFDLASHHRTNQEVLVEILALSKCHFLVHGHSAVSEAAIYTNFDLHPASVNLEDEDRLDADKFETLVRMKVSGAPVEKWPQPTRDEDFWPPVAVVEEEQPPSPTNSACEGYDGVLLISAVGRGATTGSALFTSVLNQLLFAEKYNLRPWVHLRSDVSPLIYDDVAHNNPASKQTTFQMLRGMDVSYLLHDGIDNSYYPDQPARREAELTLENFTVSPGNGIWNSYFEPVSDFLPGDVSCQSKPLIEMHEALVSPGLESFCPWSVKAWRYDNLPVSLLLGDGANQTALLADRSMKQWLEPMRIKAQKIVEKYFRFRPFITKRAKAVNPVSPEQPCLGVHFRLSDKRGKFRRTVRASEFEKYIDAFERAGGRTVYVAADAQRPLQFVFKNFPERLVKLIRTQGEHIVRSVTGEWPAHVLGDRHRVNSETLVDILALSQCSLLLHSYSTVSEAAIYLNSDLHTNSVNLEDSDCMSPKEFEMLARYVLGKDETLQAAPVEDTARSEADVANSLTPVSFKPPRVLRRDHVGRKCRTNAIIYLAQKVHSSYGRDSYSNLLRSLDLLNANYLSINNHINNTDVFIFHTGEFNRSDLDVIESRLAPPLSLSLAKGLVSLVDLSDSRFWARPRSNAKDEPTSWYAYPLFSEGYRRMMHWFAIDVWEFFDEWNQQSGCEYRYLFRLDEDSFIHSPIAYDIFEHMRSNRYVYGFRMCAYEMKVTQRMSTMWLSRHASFVPRRDLDLDMCGFYNNFFVADLHFFRSTEVSNFLRFIDNQGHIYRRRLGDLMIHSMAVYWFAPPERIHRFLDFSYEHGTFNKTDGCLIWGGIQAGYNDPNAAKTLGEFSKSKVSDLGCEVNSSPLREADLSPTYAHIPEAMKGTLSLQTITAGNVELPPGKGILSG